MQIVLLILCALLIYGLFEAHWLQVNTTVIKSNEVPISFRGTKLVFISDIHYNMFLGKRHIIKVINKINEIRPDIVLFGGDYISGGNKYIEPLFNELKNINPKIAKFGVLGNHDYYGDSSLVRLYMNKAGIEYIDNRSVWINKENERIKIGGVGDYWFDKQVIDNTTNDLTSKDFAILLSHNPDYVDEMNTDKIDLVLSGHTHAGQITFFGLFSPFAPIKHWQKYRAGLVNGPNTKVLISKGVGCTVLPIRFFARPEINVIILE